MQKEKQPNLYDRMKEHTHKAPAGSTLQDAIDKVTNNKGKGSGDGLGSVGLRLVPDDFLIQRLQSAFDYFSKIEIRDEEQESVFQEIKVITELLSMTDAIDGINKNIREVLKKATARKVAEEEEEGRKDEKIKNKGMGLK